MKYIFLFLPLLLSREAEAQDDTAWTRSHAVRIADPLQLNDSVYATLRPWPLILFGEMHGTNESAAFVQGLARLFKQKGEDVRVGLEIPESQMTWFRQHGTDSSVYQSEFFRSKEQNSGRETIAWASLIAALSDAHIPVFFFDTLSGENRPASPDSLMAINVMKEVRKHPVSRFILLSGNFHNRLSSPSMAYFLQKTMKSSLCALNMAYESGTALANFGHGLEKKQLGPGRTAEPNAVPWDRYLLMVPDAEEYLYHGFYFTRTISAATLTPH